MYNALFWLMAIGVVALIVAALSLEGMNVTASTGPSRVLW